MTTTQKFEITYDHGFTAEDTQPARQKYPFDQMEKNASFIVGEAGDKKALSRINSALCSYRKKHPAAQFKLVRKAGQLHVWKVA